MEKYNVSAPPKTVSPLNLILQAVRQMKTNSISGSSDPFPFFHQNRKKTKGADPRAQWITQAGDRKGHLEEAGSWSSLV